MTLPAARIETETVTDTQPRARGAARLSVKSGNQRDAIDGLRMSGSLKLLFPRQTRRCVDAVLINTGGGITGGDRFTTEAEAGDRASLVLTTQAAERAYRASGATPGLIETRLSAKDHASLAWLPQETILFDGAHIRRSLHVELADSARFLMVEPVVFGRAAMGEDLRDVRFHDRVEIRKAGQLVWLDSVRLVGDVATQLDRRAIGAGARAMSSLIYVAPDAEVMLEPLRALLPPTAGASLVADGILVARLLAPDSFTLRKSLVPAIKLLNSNDLPRCWML